MSSEDIVGDGALEEQEWIKLEARNEYALAFLMVEVVGCHR
jgi:hypothetical protein